MRNKKYDAVIFDLDGTLLNTLEDLMDSVNFALKSLGMPERCYEEIRHFVGNGVQRLREQYFKDYLTVAIGEKEGIRKKPAAGCL